MKILDVPQSGSVGGVTSSRNRFGQYRRTKAQPVNPRTTSQVARRVVFSDATRAWRGLNYVERFSWTQLGQQLPKTDSLGQTQYLTGAQTFIGSYIVSNLLGLTPLRGAPAVPDFSDLIFDGEPDLTADETGAAILKLNLPALKVTDGVQVYLTPNLSKGITFAKGYRQIAVKKGVLIAGVSAIDLVGIQNPIPIGACVGVRVQLSRNGIQAPRWEAVVSATE